MIAKLATDPSVSNIVEGLHTMLLIGDPLMIHFWYMQMLLGIYLFIPILRLLYGLLSRMLTSIFA